MRDSPPLEAEWRRRAGLLLTLAAVPLLAHAVVPMDEFIPRGDDAFYYFKVAANYPRFGFWTFDGIHPTNGVQPLWAVLLTAVAQALAWIGVTGPDALARIFVGLTALMHLGSGLLLYGVLSRAVSVGTGVAAAGALLFPMGIAWSRVWGMENSLYALVLLATVGYVHTRFLPQPGQRTAAIVGVLLGLTALARLNAGFLIPCLLTFVLLRSSLGDFRARLTLAFTIGATATAVLAPYFAWNLVTTGHLLPVSGAVKVIQTRDFLAAQGVLDIPSYKFFSAIFWRWRQAIEWFITSRALDGLWITGVRLLTDERGSYRLILAGLAAVLAVPLTAGRPGVWFRFLAERFRRLSQFWYILAFGTVNAVVSILLYPSEVYSTTRWWLAENEIVIVTVVGTAAAAALGFVAQRWLDRATLVRAGVTGVGALAAGHTAMSLLFYFDGVRQTHEWNQSWNDQSYHAARWINANLPAGAVVGSWNAGVLGYYAERPVVNLDGLINGFDLLPYLREKRIGEYIRHEGIEYLSDLYPKIRAMGVAETLPLTELYRSHTDWGDSYRIYRVEN